MAKTIEKWIIDKKQAYDMKKRVRLFLGGEVPSVIIEDVSRIRPGFRDTLKQFSNVIHVRVGFASNSIILSERDAVEVCLAIREMPSLQQVDLDGPVH